MQRSQTQAARAIVRRGIHRGELPASTSVTLLLETLIGGAMMPALSTPAARRAEFARTTGAHAARLDFLLRTVATPADTRAAPVQGTPAAEPYRPASR
jgi:hypothetical protein